MPKPIASLMEAIPSNWQNTTEAAIGEAILEVLDRYEINGVGRINTATIYDLMHRSGENS